MKKINITLCSNEKTIFLEVNMVSCVKRIPVKNSLNLKKIIVWTCTNTAVRK